MRDLHAEELGVATETGNPFAVRDRAGRQRGDERAVAVVVTDVAPVLGVDDAVDLRILRRDVRLAEVDAGVDDGDLDPGGRAENRVRHLVDAGGGVLPFVRDAGPVHVSNGRLRRLRLRARMTRDRPRADARTNDLYRVQRRQVALHLEAG